MWGLLCEGSYGWEAPLKRPRCEGSYIGDSYATHENLHEASLFGEGRSQTENTGFHDDSQLPTLNFGIR